MASRWNKCLYVILPVVGILPLVWGPSPSAAYAAVCEKQTRRQAPTHAGGEKAKGQQAPSDPVDGKSTTGTSHSPKPPLQKPKAFSSFVAPRAAKPSESKVTDLTSAMAEGRPLDSAFRVVRSSRTCEQHLLLSELHRRAYLAQGPP